MCGHPGSAACLHRVASTEIEGIEHQPELVAEPVRQQGVDEVGATDHVQVTTADLLHRQDRRRDVPLEDAARSEG